MKWLVRLYPAPWRRRYGDEFLALLADEGVSPRVVLHVLLGALDARHQQDILVVDMEDLRRKLSLG